MTDPVIRAAASVILWRSGTDGPEVLMGRRGSGAAFMPMKHVFPGGAVDPEDAATALAPGTLGSACARRLTLHCPDAAPGPVAIAAAALRELREETGLSHGGADIPPAARSLRFVFRALTPPGRSRRFDARFLLADARGVAGDAGDFSAADDELADLHWVPLDRVRRLDLPFVTGIVAAEVAALLRGDPDQGVPFFDNADEVPTFRRLE